MKSYVTVVLVCLAAAAREDSLLDARCAAACWDDGFTPDDEVCVAACRERPTSKPGTCPQGDLTVFAAACIEACHKDAACPGTAKCCTHRCGATCQEPLGINTLPGLPEVPANVTVVETRRGRHVRVHWTGPAGRGIVYLVQQKQHVGREYSAGRLGPWVSVARTAAPITALRRPLRPGRWYLFRVAAVCANGTRGFSQPSSPFTLSLEPKRPGPPTNLNATWQRAQDGSYTGLLTWQPPVSDLPIQRYRVYFSRRLSTSSSTPTSVFREKECVSRHTTKLQLRNLLPNSQYFLQVQALAQFGVERLKGEMAAVVLNTIDSKQQQ